METDLVSTCAPTDVAVADRTHTWGVTAIAAVHGVAHRAPLPIRVLDGRLRVKRAEAEVAATLVHAA